MSDDFDVDFVKDQIGKGIQMLDDADRDFLLDKIEESRWKTGPTYNQGVHLLMDVLQYALESSYDSPNRRF